MANQPVSQPPAAPAAAPTASSPNSAPPAPQPDGHIAVPLTFWQQPWVQQVLPFVTSVTVHISIILIGVVFYLGARYVEKKIVHQEEVIIPDASMINDGAPGGIPNQGLGNDPNRQAFQDKLKDGGTPQGWAEKKGSSFQMQAMGGGEGESNDNVIGLGAGGGFGRGKGGRGSGVGNELGAGDGDGSGALAMFGTPGGGGIGLKGPVFGHSGNAHKITFVCDASGSMLNKFSTLRRELARAVQGLKPIQSFDIIFFQDQTKAGFAALSQNLVMATPENKLKVDTYLGTVIPRGSTNPLPGLDLAFKQRPDLIYLLTDGDFPDNKAVLERINLLNKDHRVKINTIAFVAESDTDTDFMALLKKIAQDSGGVYRFVKEGDL